MNTLTDEELEPDIQSLGNTAFKLAKHGITELTITTDAGAVIEAKFKVTTAASEDLNHTEGSQNATGEDSV